MGIATRRTSESHRISTRKRTSPIRRGGRVVERVRTAGRLPTNVAFGSRGEKKIYVTEDQLGQMEAFDVGTDGLPLYV
jgi:sugar lactone lactonase YvrE